MAKNKRGRHYKLTPRRKTAILKAQAASARKRRRTIGNIAKGIGVVAVTGAAAGFGMRHMGRSRKNSSVGKQLDVIRIAPRVSEDTGRVFFGNVGAPVAREKLPDSGRGKRRKRKLPNYREWEQNRIKKIKQKEIKNWKERRKYWQSKPVPKVKRKR